MCISDDEREREKDDDENIFRVFSEISENPSHKSIERRGKRERDEESSRTEKEKKKRRKEKKEKKNTYAASLESLASAVVEPTHVSINADYYYLGTVTYRLFLEDSLYRFILNHRSGLTPSPPLASKASFNSNGNASVH
jgi:hypothetical protein